MKKFLVIVLVLLIIVVGVTGYFKIKNEQKEKILADIKKGWYVEILADEVNIREKGSRESNSLRMAQKGEVFKVLDIDILGDNNFWYKIEFDDEQVGFIFNSSKYNYLEDFNNPKDVAIPILKFYDPIYYVNSIDDINYDDLEVWDDKPNYEITHKVFHETGIDFNGKNIDQYWIQYTVTDGAGNQVSKVQKIEFNQRPSEDRVYNFLELKR